VPTDERWAADEESGAALPLLDGWEQVPAPLGAAIAVALTGWHPAPGIADCRPNVVLTTQRSDDTPDLLRFGTEAIAQALAIADGARVLAYDVWATAGDRPEGRHLCFAYQQGDLGIYVSQFVFVADGVLTAVTGTCGVDVADVLTPVFDATGAGVRLRRGAAA
jgi:hypothetical protein